ncbi:alpha/beta hydrolase [Thalassobacillus hwangdonensis]|uniref:Alpha/beta hydrolase n=1 Tax=Thalassobacillus hwangdonensis TaxID=546108 RepID=A0ABW3KXM6_9BACI
MKMDLTSKSFICRDLHENRYFNLSSSDNNVKAIIMIHGITAELHHHEQFGANIASGWDVLFPVLRGYDKASSGRGDIDHMGQFDEDILDFIHFLRKKGYQKIVLAGHSMGCGNILRLIGKPNLVDGYLFISPFFHPALPVYKRDSTKQDKPETDVDYDIDTKRVFVLTTLYRMNLNLAPKASVATIPDEFEGDGKLKLSFRLLASRFMKELPSKDHFSQVSVPMVTLIGSDDEVTHPEKLKDWYEERCDQPFHIIDGTDHNHILHDERALRIINEWLDD